MATVEVFDWNNKKVGSADLKADVFEAPVRKDILHEVVRWQRACKRQGTHKAKTRGEVRGGGKKPFKQKGTGNARQGSIRSPLKQGGGVIFGPTPRDYSFNIPKKVKKLALRSALSYLYKNGKLKVVDSMNSSEGKTKDLVSGLKALELDKTVLIDAESNDLFKRAAQNIKGIQYYPVTGLNVYDLLKYDNLVVTKDSLAKIEQRCGVS